MNQELEKRLKKETTAELHFDPAGLEAWSTDASIFKIKPIGIALPKTQEDVRAICRIAKELSIPLIPRGAATGITGGCLGKGLVVDVSKYLNQILEINFEQEYVVVEPGVILDDLNHKLAERGYRLGPETSTANRATLGGMAANNASGARSIRFGKMVDSTLEAKIFVPGGDQALLKSFTESEWESKIREESPTGSVVRAVIAIQEQYKNDILAHFPTLDRHVSGYNLDEAVKTLHPNLAKLVVGSEGSLGLITSLKLSIVKKPDHLGLALIHFHTLEEAFKALPSLLHWDYLSLELVDDKLLKMAAEVPRIKKGMGWIFGEPGAILIAEFDTESIRDTQLKLSSFEADMRHHGIGYAYYLMTRPEEMKQVWDMRKSGLGLLMSKRSYTNAIAFLEDMAVPPSEVAPFMVSFSKLLRENDLEAGVYGHIGVGCLHIRPYLNLSDPKDLAKITPLMQKAAGLILKHKGSLSGEHGDGLIRSWLNETLFGSRVMEAFLLLKQAFDPLNLMNPGKVVNGVPFDALQEDLRLNPKTALNTIPTYLSFEKEGGFALTADLCNGNGECRKQTGIMCPSFQATLDEFNTTRARANVLQSMIHKTKGAINWNDPSVRKVLDLCLECKGCKTECPSAVDMTKLKMEFLYHYNKWNGISLRTRLLSSFSKWIHIGALMPRFTTWLISRDWVKEIQKWLRIAPERSLPTPAPERFSVWFSRNVQGKQVKGKQVVLYNDTYTEFLYPEVGISAVKILHLLGYEVILPPWRCCGRPLLSKGRLKKGQKMATKVIRTLTPYLKAKIPVLGLEPSCLFTLLDEYQDLPDLDAKALKSVAKTFDRFVADHLEEGKLPLPFKESACKIKVHGHCHEKAIEGIESTLAVLRAIPGVEVEAIPSGCCGMAGSFGYEQEHYDLSMKIGELVLLPEVRRASKETLIVANGFSCRTQIADGAGRSAIHLAEALNRFLTILLLATTFGIASLQGQESKPVIQEVPTNEKIAMPQYLYKIVSREEWQASQEHKVVEKSPLDTAFIHLATEEQIVHVTEKFWKDKAYFILKLDPSKLKGRLVLETNPGGTTRYYHLYEGSIPLDAVVEVLTP